MTAARFRLFLLALCFAAPGPPRPLHAQSPPPPPALNFLTDSTGPLTPEFHPLIRSYTREHRLSRAAIRAVPAAPGLRMEVSLNGGPFKRFVTGPRIAIGSSHALAVKADGTVALWPVKEGAAAVEPPAGLHGVVSVAAGDSHFLALKADGTVAGWGVDEEGQATVPEGLTGVVAIAAGGTFSMALQGDGTAVYWGRAFPGKFRAHNNAVAIAVEPEQCAAILRNSAAAGVHFYNGGTGMAGVGVGRGYTTVLTQEGEVLTGGRGGDPFPEWGLRPAPAVLLDARGTAAVLMDGSAHVAGFRDENASHSLPSDLGRILEVTGRASFGYAVMEDGVIRGWGENSAAPPGVAAGTDPLFVPVRLRPGLNTAEVRVTAADGAASETYRVHINRRPNVDLQLLRLEEAVLTPPFYPAVESYAAAVPFHLSEISLIIGLSDPTSTVTINGAPAAERRTLTLDPGFNTFTIRITAEDGVTAAERILHITRAASSAVAGLGLLKSEAGLLSPSFDPEIYRYTFESPPPGEVTFWPRPSHAAAALSVRVNGGAWTPLSAPGLPPVTGSSNFSMILRPDGTVVTWAGAAETYLKPPEGLGGIVAVSAGNYHAMALDRHGRVRVWGGIWEKIPAAIPETAFIAAGKFHCLALSHAGAVTAWGQDSEGQCRVPAGLPPLIAAAGGRIHSLGLSRDGQVFSWGGLKQSGVPVMTPPAVSIGAGDEFSAALRGDGTVAAWGNNTHGQTRVPEGLKGVRQMVCGSRHVMVLKADGTLTAWGDNAGGQCDIPSGLSDVIAINASGTLSVAIKKDGTPVIWGGFHPEQRTVPAGVSVSAAPSFISVPSFGEGDVIEFKAASRNGAEERIYTVTGPGSADSPYAPWAAAAFPAGTPAALKEARGDFDGDGALNGWEYLTGSDPLSAASGGGGRTPLTIRAEGAEAVIAYPRRPGVPAGWETLETSSSLNGPWTAAPPESLTLSKSLVKNQL